jgi:arginyl-tRNA synthetase
MQTITVQLSHAFRAAIAAAVGFDADPLISVSQNPKFGDYQSNAAMGLAKQVAQNTGQKTNPRAIAEQIKSKLELGEMAEEVSLAGPGFINVRLSPRWLADQLQLIENDPRLGLAPSAEPQTVVVDYSGPNIAKQMHVGHLRSTIIGDAIARVLQFQGNQVIRQNHIGDWGLQMGMVTYALETSGEGGELTLGQLEQLYKKINAASEDPVMRRQMADRTRDLQQTPKAELAGWQRVRTLTLNSAQQMYRRLNVLLAEADVRGESFYSDQYAPMVEQLKAEGKAVETAGAVGLFPPGFTNKEGEPRPFLIQSRDGTFQYPTFDLAALRFRVQQLHAQRIIYTHDSRQAEHFAMLFSVAHLLGWDHVGQQPVEFDYAPFGTVLGEDGRPLKTRQGENVKLAEVLDEAEQRAYELVSVKSPELSEAKRRDIARAVGIGGVKYADLSKDRTSDYVFSWEKMLSLDGNTAPYLQYAYARIQSIFRKAEAVGIAVQRPFVAPIQLDSPFELNLAKHLMRLGDVIDLVARELKPHHLCTFLYELATRFSSFFENCPVLQSEEPLRASRLALCELTGRTLALGLDLLGIESPEQM